MPETDLATRWPNYWEDDFVIRDYRFTSGDVLPEVKLHYRTMGVPRRNAARPSCDNAALPPAGRHR